MISVFGSSVGQEEIKQISESITNQWMGMGPKTKEFEKRMSERYGTTKFLLTDSGSNSLYLALSLLNLPKGSEVIVPSFTWVACAQVVLLVGCVPVFCDVDIDTQNMTAETIKPCISDNTAAIMVVHYAGLPCEMDEIIGLGYPVVEDAAHAVDSVYKGKRCGTIGEIGCFSFDAIKNIAIGEGGGITSKSSDLMKKAETLRYCGIGKSGFEASTHGKRRWWEYNIQSPFIKMNPSDIAAGIGLAQLEKLDNLQERRKTVWEIYQKEFSNVEWIVTPRDANNGDRHSYFSYFIRVKERDDLAAYLYKNDIYTTLRYHPLHLNSVYGSSCRLPNCEQLNEDGLNIPLHPNLDDNDVDKIVSVIKDFKH